MKRKKPQVEKPSVGTVIGAKYRARCNELTDREREKLNDEFMKLYYAIARHWSADLRSGAKLLQF